MKKIKLFAALLCSMMFFAAGCQSDDVMVLTPNGDAVIKDDGSSSGTNGGTSNNNKKPEKETEKPAEKPTKGDSDPSGLITVGFAQVGSESGWRLAQTDSMKKTFTEANGYKLDFVDCNNDQNTQISTIEKFVNDGVDYIVLDPIVETGYDDVLKKAKDAGIPVIVVDRNISAAKDLYTCWVGSDFTNEGKVAGEWLKEYLAANNRADEDINIVTIQGSSGASATLGRTLGFTSVLTAQENWTALDKQSGDFTEDGGYAVMKAFLSKYKNIDVVVCQNDDEAFGAITAIKEQGLTCGPNGDIIIISFDATKKGFERMIAGEINVDIECNPLEGPLVAELIQKLEKGEEVEKIQYVEEGIFPADTAADVIGSRVY